MLSYVETHAVIARLNEGCDSWSFEVLEHQVLDTEVIVLGRLTADGVVKCAFGGSHITIDKNGEVASIADDLKSAASDSLKKSASLLGSAWRSTAASLPTNPSGPKTLVSVPVNDRVTSRQLSALHSASRRRGLGQDGLVALVQQRAGKDAITALSKARPRRSSPTDRTNGGGR